MSAIIHYHLDDGSSKGFAILSEYIRPDGKHVVVISQSPDNAGASITNSCCTIADVLYQKGHLIDFYVEHWPADAYQTDDYEENWSLVSFDWRVSTCTHRHPNWHHLSKEHFELLTAGTWDPPDYQFLRSRL